MNYREHRRGDGKERNKERFRRRGSRTVRAGRTVRRLFCSRSVSLRPNSRLQHQCFRYTVTHCRHFLAAAAQPFPSTVQISSFFPPTRSKSVLPGWKSARTAPDATALNATALTFPVSTLLPHLFTDQQNFRDATECPLSLYYRQEELFTLDYAAYEPV